MKEIAQQKLERAHLKAAESYLESFFGCLPVSSILTIQTFLDLHIYVYTYNTKTASALISRLSNSNSSLPILDVQSCKSAPTT